MRPAMRTMTLFSSSLACSRSSAAGLPSEFSFGSKPRNFSTIAVIVSSFPDSTTSLRSNLLG